jgi:hypothetical protein
MSEAVRGPKTATKDEQLTLVHFENAGKGLLGVLEGAITVVENADPIPQFGVFLGAGQVEEGVLIGCIGGLKFILHEVTMT